MPIYHGEAIVLRLLDQSSSRKSFADLGFPPDIAARFTALIERSAGMVLVTGPTGSGKTTTLYAALQHVNSAATKIITAEDPIEYRLERVNQVQVNPKIGLTFSAILRTALRQDPDVVLVGEMRDNETTEIGLRAAMTGHLVFSTLHTQSAVATVGRLLDMGAQGYLIASALDGVLAQRLVRRVCENCSQPTKPTVQQQSWLSRYLSPAEIDAAQFVEGAGCTYCNMTGFRGRIGIYELLEIDSRIAAAIRATDLTELERLAASAPGYAPLIERALEQALAGTTSVAEIMTSLAGVDEPVQRESLLDDVLTSATAADAAVTESVAAQAARLTR
jgi:MSHA biogenesis protein MshE